MIKSPPHFIEARRVRFHLPRSLPKIWNGSAAKTHLFNAIAILTPTFERLAIASVLPFKNKISDPLLAEQVQGFIGQESAHGSEFIRYNQILKQQGYQIRRLEKSHLKLFRWVASKLSAKMHLSFTLAAEHLTALISDLILREKSWLQEAFPLCSALWHWHAIEEIEHKGVVFDLYHSLKGGYWLRIIGMIMMSTLVAFMLWRNFFHLVIQDKLFFKGKFWIACWRLWWGKQGMLRKLLVPYLRYYSPRFHPWQQDNHDLVNKWKNLLKQANTFEEAVTLLQRT